MLNLGHGSYEGNTGAAEPSATNPERKCHWARVNGLRCAASHTHTTSLRCHPHVPTFEPCPTWGMVQMRVTPGPQNQAQRTQSVSPIGLVVNGLHCAASHTHTTSLRCHPHVPTLNHAQLGHFLPCPCEQ